MPYSDLVFERRDHVAVITLNRPEKLNALGKNLQDEMRAACDEAKNDDAVRAVVWTGAGRGFCSGADLTGVRSDGESVAPQNERLDEMGWVGRQAMAIYNLDKPTIAAVNGVAAGAGMSLALACDIRVGSRDARFKTVFIERSLSPDSGMSFFLPRIIGYGRAADLIFTSRAVNAEEAYRLGLLDRLIEGDDLVDQAVALANDITRWPPVAMRSAKRVLQHNLQVDLEEALRFEYAGLTYARRAPHDVAESLRSFIEKRTPHYTGE
ncbi:MAG: enoyl-CoA hydratase/isomerase family protein [Dehalococcoidia bacterium]|nr:enoyl-CoA hydratase/isomerase family protein [Dehalococcoidia bacterium]MCB9485873.1 enoyl-CoA hydratase/isomerase family protein [Thermoflexaceae bacterium]